MLDNLKNIFKRKNKINNLPKLKKLLNASHFQKDFKEIIESLLNGNIENSVALYSQFLNNNFNIPLDDKYYSKLFKRDDFINLIKTYKTRYYEFLISLAPNELKELINDRLYSLKNQNNINFFQDVRNVLFFNKLNSGNDFFYDRLLEWKLLFGLDEIPYSTKKLMFQHFDSEKVSDDFHLFELMKEITPLYFLRKLQMPTLFDFLRLDKILSEVKNTKLKVLDYGCGSADLIIYLAKKDCEISLCDIEGGNLDYAVKRFKIRNMDVNFYGSNEQNPIPNIEGSFDLIISIEVLEHIRNPFDLLKMFDRLISKDGYIMLGSFPFTATEAKGDHLSESVSKQKELYNWIDTNWTRVELGFKDNTFKKK